MIGSHRYRFSSQVLGLLLRALTTFTAFFAIDIVLDLTVPGVVF